MTRKRIQAVQDHLDKYGDDREIDYLFMAFDRNTELMTADYQINEYSDDLAEGIAQAMTTVQVLQPSWPTSSLIADLIATVTCWTSLVKRATKLCQLTIRHKKWPANY